jgi:hypothetical protein
MGTTGTSQRSMCRAGGACEHAVTVGCGALCLQVKVGCRAVCLLCRWSAVLMQLWLIQGQQAVPVMCMKVNDARLLLQLEAFLNNGMTGLSQLCMCRAGGAYEQAVASNSRRSCCSGLATLSWLLCGWTRV